jgi:hypothetical protein
MVINGCKLMTIHGSPGHKHRCVSSTKAGSEFWDSNANLYVGLVLALWSQNSGTCSEMYQIVIVYWSACLDAWSYHNLTVLALRALLLPRAIQDSVVLGVTPSCASISLRPTQTLLQHD